MGREVRDGVAALRVAALDRFIESVESREIRKLEDALLVLAVMTEHAVERLKRDVAPVEHVEHAHRMHVVMEPAPRARMEDVVQTALACVSEGRVTKVVPETDRLDEVAIKAEGVADVARNTGYKLHMEATPREVVVGTEREDLRLPSVAVVGGQVKDLLDVAHIGRAPKVGLVRCPRLAPERVCPTGAIWVLPSVCAVLSMRSTSSGERASGMAAMRSRTASISRPVRVDIALPFPLICFAPIIAHRPDKRGAAY